jgi:carboxypeptidase family protein/TonB-dependent receptor-like protein
MPKQVLILALLLAAGIDASAQEFTGSIYGRIVDPTNALLPGVSITVEGAAIQGQRTAESEANGSYRVLYLPPGEYRVTYQKSKFKKTVYEGAKVEVGKTVTMNVTMEIADIEETVVVTRSSPIVDVRNATVGTNFGEAMLRDIPSQRDLFALLALTPGITLPRVDVGGNTAGTQSAYRAYGLSGQSITTVDGVNITDGSSAIGAYIDYGAMAEAKIAAAGNSAEVPVAGAAVTTVIKSGSNTHHGELYTDFKPEGSKGYTGAETFLRYLDINAQLGGPLIKDKFWYFTSLRGQQTASVTGMYNTPAAQGGTPGQVFTTETTDYTLKLNYQLSHRNTLTFMTQFGRKHQPYRFGSGPGAFLYLVESTALQNSWSEIGKVDYTRVINNRATLDASINFYGTRFPLTARTDKTPIIDDITYVRSGAYPTPSLSQDRRWHYNTNLNLYAGKHDMKIGYMYQRYAPRYTAYGAPGPAGTVGHFYISTTNGAPSAFWTDNGPVWNVNVLENHAVFFQDRIQVTAKLTVNVGVRFDQYHSSYPEQRFGLNGNVGPFAVPTVTPARDIVTFNTVVPRVALIYDPFGKSKTALKASWGRYATNPAASIASWVNPIDLISKKYAWDDNDLTADPAVAATRITPAYVATRQPILGGAQLTPTTVDPDLKDSYTDDFTLGAEQEIAGNLRGYVTLVRKQQKNTFGRYDRLRTLSNYTPVQVVDPGPDGAVNSADDRTITVFETGVPPDTTDYYLTNKPIGDTYDTIEFGVTKRMSDHWQMISGVDWTKRDLASLFSEDPNTVFWNSTNTRTTGWTFKASGSYLFNHGLLVGVSYNAMKGEPYGRFFTITPEYLTLADPKRTAPLVQGNMQIIAEKAGTYYLPAINVINLRVQKEFVIKGTQRIQLMLNLLNFTDARTVTAVYTLTNQSFGYPTDTLDGTVVRFSARYIF